MWVGFVILEYVSYVSWVPYIKREYLLVIHAFRSNLEIWVESYSRHYA